MCGINGILNYLSPGSGIKRDELVRTRDHMRARGPDGSGEWYSDDGSIGLAHRRLAIIDLSAAGAQPMNSATGRFTITFNGEIYNYGSLRDRLSAQGAVFRSHSDTEVLLELYARIGPAMIHDLRGMYAFAIWDDVAKTLFLARDPYGVKPLYYSDTQGTFRFASQVKALLAGGAVSQSVEPAALAGFLVWGSVPEPFTFHQGIRALAAGHTMLVTRDGVGAPKQFWDLGAVISRSLKAAEDIPRGDELAVVRDAMRDTVRAHLVADVPVGAFLSAGLDSSTLVGFARELAGDVRTITFSSEEFGGSEDEEGPLAAEVARHFGVSHQRHTIGRTEFENDLGAFLNAMDQPTIDGLNTWFVSKAASEAGLKVALSGMGGDELFGSYSTFNDVPAMARRYRPLVGLPGIGEALRCINTMRRSAKTTSRPMLDGAPRYGGTIDGAYLLHRGWIPPWQLHKVIRRDIADEGLARLAETIPMTGDTSPLGLNDFGRVAYLEATRYMRNQLLRDSDWTAMAHSLEIRVPMVDICFTERVIGLAASGRIPNGKVSFADIVPGGLPASIVNRPKTGFSIPIWIWLQKSAQASAWMRNRFLRENRVGAYSRWAYCVLASQPEISSALR